MVCGHGGLSIISRGGRTFGGLGFQVQSDGSSERNIFDDLCTEEVMGAGGDIFEVVFKFAASEARK